MPIHANRIVFGSDPADPDDYFAFEDIRGRLQPKSNQIQVLVRAGENGETIRTTGIRGTPHSIVTIHYVEDWAAAKAALEAYIELKDGQPYEIVQHSTSYGYFKILDVTEIDARACANVVGSIVSNPTVLQICQWTVVSTDAP